MYWRDLPRAGTSGLLHPPVTPLVWSMESPQSSGFGFDERLLSSAEVSVVSGVISSVVDSRIYAGESHIISNNPLQSYSLSQKFRDRQTAFTSPFEDSGSLSGEFSTVL